VVASVDGLISGMDTSTIISQLMQLERQPVTRLEQQKATAAAKVGAMMSLNAKFSTLQTAADAITGAAAWQGRMASSTSSAVSASASTNALTGSFTFDVEQIATAQSYVSNATFSSTAAVVTSASSITITKGDGTPVAVDTGNGSLATVVANINTANVGVRAAATQVSPGLYRLQLTSTTTGAASDFTIVDGVDTAPLGALDELVAGQDARIGVGALTAPGRYTATSASNTFSDVMPGLSLTVKEVATNVTVNVTTDVATVSGKVKAMVDAANGVLAEVKKLTAYDVTSKKGGPLVGDSTARALQQEVLRLTSSMVGAGQSAAGAGIELQRDGTLTFDPVVFADAFEVDPVATARLFRPGGTMVHANPVYAELADTVAFLGSDDRTVPGTYAVTVTTAARQAMVRVTGAVADGDTLTLAVPGQDDVVVTAVAGDDLADLAVKINTQSTTHSLGLVAQVEGGELIVRTVQYGSAPTFAITGSGALVADPVVAGLDVAGTINGVAATGTGQALSAPAADTTLRGLTFIVTATAADVALAAGQAGADAGLFGSFTYSPGLAQRLDSLAGDAVRSGSGRLTTAIAGRNALIDDLTDRIDGWDERLVLREAQLRRTYSGLEVALGKLRDQSNWLAGQLAGLTANSGS
jgi:flagellar hook-associated protein 2